jgi:hypothetical protein
MKIRPTPPKHPKKSSLFQIAENKNFKKKSSHKKTIIFFSEKIKKTKKKID